MPVYAYKGFDAAGKAVSGTRDADNPRIIKQILRRDGIFLTELSVRGSTTQKEKGKKGSGPSFLAFLQERVSAQDLAMATR